MPSSCDNIRDIDIRLHWPWKLETLVGHPILEAELSIGRITEDAN